MNNTQYYKLLEFTLGDSKCIETSDKGRTWANHSYYEGYCEDRY